MAYENGINFGPSKRDISSREERGTGTTVELRLPFQSQEEPSAEQR